MIFALYPSLAAALKTLYPDFPWNTSQFWESKNLTPPGYFRDPNNLRPIIEDIGKKLGVNQVIFIYYYFYLYICCIYYFSSYQIGMGLQGRMCKHREARLFSIITPLLNRCSGLFILTSIGRYPNSRVRIGQRKVIGNKKQI